MRRRISGTPCPPRPLVPRDRAHFLTRLAQARLQLRELDGACRAATEAATITEDVAPVTRNIYGATKLTAEDLCALAARTSACPYRVIDDDLVSEQVAALPTEVPSA